MDDRGSQAPDVVRKNRNLDRTESFRFACHPGVPCFNDCCGDVNIILTPVDVLRLARRVGISTGEFLDEYCQIPITKDLKLPVVMLKMGDDRKRKCRFVGEEGCSVYEDRPWACRMYPLGMAIPPARAGVEPEPVFFLFQDDFCHGREENRHWTIDQWRADQDVTRQEELETGFREIVSHPWFIGGRQLDPRRLEMFYTACYDLDKFRSFVFESTFLERFEVEPELVEEIREDDEALLAFGFRWLRYALFAEPTVKVKDGAKTAPRKA
jgi:Fe-S-cluster containining protein